MVPKINRLRSAGTWDLIVLTQDWHPAGASRVRPCLTHTSRNLLGGTDHISFASNNEGATVFETRELPDIGQQVMWPDHCVQESKGAEFHPDLVRYAATCGNACLWASSDPRIAVA